MLVSQSIMMSFWPPVGVWCWTVENREQRTPYGQTEAKYIKIKFNLIQFLSIYLYNILCWIGEGWGRWYMKERKKGYRKQKEKKNLTENPVSVENIIKSQKYMVTYAWNMVYRVRVHWHYCVRLKGGKWVRQIFNKI